MKKLLLFIFIALTIQVNASHQVAGDIGYHCLGNNQYEFYIYFYRDCSGIPAPTSLTIGGTSSCGNVNIALNQVDLSPNDPSSMGINDTINLCESFNSSCNGGTFPGVEIYKYVGTTTLVSCADWIFCGDDCCRNPAPNFPPLTASTNYSGSSIAYSCTINNANGVCSDSPVWKFPPRAYVCQDIETTLNNGAIDIDGDSLFFELITVPDGCNGGNVTYITPFSATYPITTTTGTFPFDANTGISVFTPVLTPNIFEVSVLGIKISEYRNGVLIGTIIRDMQIVTIQGCDPLNASSQGVSNIGPQTTVSNDTITVYAGETLDFSVIAVDPINIDSFPLYNTLVDQIPAVQFSYASFQAVNIMKGTTILVTDTSHIGTYNFHILASNDGCPVPIIDTLFDLVLQVLPNPNASINSLIGKKKFKIYPNPTSGELNVILPENSRKAEICVFDIAGKEYFSKRLNSITSTIDLDIPKGVYFVKIESDRNSVVKKLIID